MPHTDSDQSHPHQELSLPLSQEIMTAPLQPESVDAMNNMLGPQAFEDLFEASGIGKAILDEQGRVKTSNQSFEELLSYTAEELSAQTLSDWLTPEDQSMMFGSNWSAAGWILIRPKKV